MHEIPGLTHRENKVLDVVWRYHQYVRFLCNGLSKARARREAGISRYYAERCEAAEEDARFNSHVEPMDPTDPKCLPY